MSKGLQGISNTERRRGHRPFLVAVVAILAFAAIGSAPQASASGTTTRPASLGPGVDQPSRTEPLSFTVHAALRCAEPAKAVGFKESRAQVAVAVGMAESYCRAHAEGHNGPTGGCPNGSYDRGLWQINSCYHPEVSRHCAFKATCNARAAKRISEHGRNWTPWSTYNSGAYEQYMDAAKRAVKKAWSR